MLNEANFLAYVRKMHQLNELAAQEMQSYIDQFGFDNMSYLVMKEQLRGLKHSFDAAEYGGAPLLGLQKPVIKAHGSSDAKAICNAVRQAEAFVKTGVIDQITAVMQEQKKQVEQ